MGGPAGGARGTSGASEGDASPGESERVAVAEEGGSVGEGVEDEGSSFPRRSAASVGSRNLYLLFKDDADREKGGATRQRLSN